VANLNTAQTIQKIVSLKQRPLFIIAVGLPGCGKSTLLCKIAEALKVNGEELVITATDNEIVEFSKARNISYQDAITDHSFKIFAKAFKAKMIESVSQGKNVAVDQTNVKRRTRERRLRMLDCIKIPYYKICLNVDVPEAVLKKRLADRAISEGKVIPDRVIAEKIKEFETPNKSEGFHLVIEVKP
jgi:tRNA uridine 5-carbamoylmethylation protein Kti12